MHNQNARPAIVPPVVPSNIETLVGTSKSDFVKAILDLVAQSTITGINQENPDSFDISSIQQTLEEQGEDIAALNARTPRRIIQDGVSNGIVVVPFPDIGTINYQVSLAYVTPNVNFDPIQWSIVENEKKTNQVMLRLDGRSGTFEIEVTITPMDGI
jgi:hypothetical protein